MRQFFAISLVLLLAASALPTLAYDGVLAPAPKGAEPAAKPQPPAPPKSAPNNAALPAAPATQTVQKPTVQTNDGGYAGVIAPAPANAKKPAATSSGPGYAGLIAGEIAEPQGGKLINLETTESEKEKALAVIPSLIPEAKQSRPVPPRMTPNPRLEKIQQIKDERMLRFTAMLHGFENRMLDAHMPKMNPETLFLMGRQVEKENGLTKTERTVQSMSLEKMQALADPKLSPEERRALAKKSYEDLLKTADAIIFRSKAQQRVFGAAGAPKELLQARRESNERALDILSQTIRSLKKAAEE